MSENRKEPTTKMTSKKTPEDNQGIDWETLLLQRFKRADAELQKAHDHNSSKGISKELERQYISYTKPQAQQKYERFLHSVINPDTGEWYDIKFLRATKQLNKSIDSDFEGRTYPRVELYRIIRVLSKNKEDCIFRCLNLIGLNAKGQEVAEYVDDVDLERIPKIKFEPLPAQTIPSGSEYEEDSYGKTMIATLVNHELMYHGTEIAPTKYLVLFSEDTIRQWISEGQEHLHADPYNGINFAIKKEGEHKSYTVKTLEQFLTPSFDQLFEQVSQPPKTINEEDLRRLGKIFKGEDSTTDVDKKNSEPYK
jgi:hypothetical protein